MALIHVEAVNADAAGPLMDDFGAAGFDVVNLEPGIVMAALRCVSISRGVSVTLIRQAAGMRRLPPERPRAPARARCCRRDGRWRSVALVIVMMSPATRTLWLCNRYP